MVAFGNTKADEESDELFDKINNKFGALKKLVKAVSNTTKRKRINNVIKGVEFVLDHVAFLGDSDNDSDIKRDFSIVPFSGTNGQGLKILASNQMLNNLYEY